MALEGVQNPNTQDLPEYEQGFIGMHAGRVLDVAHDTRYTDCIYSVKPSHKHPRINRIIQLNIFCSA